MKIVLDNIIFFLQRSGGMSVYWCEIISRLEQIKNLDVKYLEPSGNWNNIFYGSIRQKIQARVNIEKGKAKFLSFFFYHTKERDKYIFHSSYYRTAKSAHAINIVTIHDFIPEFFFTGIKRQFHSYRKRKALKNADGIVCISDNTHTDLLKYYPWVKDIPTKIIYNGVSNDYYPLEKNLIEDLRLPVKYILFVGKRPDYKNFRFAIDVLTASTRYHFVIVGEQLSEDELKYLLKLKDNYTFIANPDNRKLNQLYNRAYCLLYPSSYEGFGIPVIEAMKAGCPVVGLHAGSVPEIANGAALLAQDLNVAEFLNYISFLEDNSVRNDIVSRGIENAKKFSWENSVSELISFYKELYYGSNL